MNTHTFTSDKWSQFTVNWKTIMLRPPVVSGPIGAVSLWVGKCKYSLASGPGTTADGGAGATANAPPTVHRCCWASGLKQTGKTGLARITSAEIGQSSSGLWTGQWIQTVLVMSLERKRSSLVLLLPFLWTVNPACVQRAPVNWAAAAASNDQVKEQANYHLYTRKRGNSQL